MKIAIPRLALAQPLLEHAAEISAQNGFTLIEASLEECGTMLLNNNVDVALMSPHGYGLGVGKVDYRIIPGPCLALEDYTHAYGLWFPESGSALETFHATNPDAYLSVISRLVMAEKFDVHLEFTTNASAADVTIGPTSEQPNPAMDLGEEWFDIVESPLPVAVWVHRVDTEHLDHVERVREFADQHLLHREVSEVVPLTADHMPREGKVLYRWNDEVQEGLEASLHMLFYHQLLSEIPAIKLFGTN
jgi:hypothetical protein